MRITESRLRSIIRSVIVESLESGVISGSVDFSYPNQGDLFKSLCEYFEKELYGNFEWKEEGMPYQELLTSLIMPNHLARIGGESSFSIEGENSYECKFRVDKQGDENHAVYTFKPVDLANEIECESFKVTSKFGDLSLDEA